MDKDKDMDKDMVKVKKKGEKIELVFPFTSDQFINTWNILIKEKKWRHKSPAALQASLKFLSSHSEPEAIEIMERSIAGEWQGLFELDNKNTPKISSNGKRYDKDGNELLAGKITVKAASEALAAAKLFRARQEAADGNTR